MTARADRRVRLARRHPVRIFPAFEGSEAFHDPGRYEFLQTFSAMDRVAEETRRRGLRVVAVFEGAKGGLVLVTGFGLLAFIHRGLHNAAEEVVRHLHLNPARHYPRIFLDAAARVTDTQLWLLALSAFLYAVVRFIEAFGLWRRKRWAAWFGVVSGGVYVPVELFEAAHRLSWVKLGVLSANLAIVAYLGYELTIHGRPPRNPSLPRSPRPSIKR